MRRFSQVDVHACGRRFVEGKTKGSPFMKHLDLYARRDPQLAPYLLREVDIEYKRKCRKYRLQAEELSYLRQYAEYVRAEQDARDDDNVDRRRIFVALSNAVKDAFMRDQQWHPDDTAKCFGMLQ